MAGSLIFGNRLIRSNATVTIQRAISAFSNGTPVETFENVATGVEVLFTLVGGGRDGTYGSDNQRDQGTISGVNSNLDRTDVRYLITDFPTMPFFVNTYWRVNSPNRHPIGLGGLQCMRIRVSVSRLDMPADGV